MWRKWGFLGAIIISSRVVVVVVVVLKAIRYCCKLRWGIIKDDGILLQMSPELTACSTRRCCDKVWAQGGGGRLCYGAEAFAQPFPARRERT